MPDTANSANTRPTAMAPDASTSPVDWSRPIEAVHPDGRTVSVSLSSEDGQNPDADGDYITTPVLDDGSNLWNSNGANWSGAPWRIRNVQPTIPERDPALWDRMVALLTRMSHKQYEHGVPDYDEARAIVADLPKPVDPDEEIARDLVRAAYPEMKAGYAGRHYQIALAALKRGRELAAPEVSHVG